MNKLPATNAEAEAALEAYFPPYLVKWKPNGKPRDGKILLLPFIDARDVSERLDAVFGKSGWECQYAEFMKDSILCTLRTKFPESKEWTVKQDTGSPSDIYGGTEADNVKGGTSDALKRAAVQYGIGRYLYRMPDFYVPGDAKNWNTPTIPNRFRPPEYRTITDATAAAVWKKAEDVGKLTNATPDAILDGFLKRNRLFSDDKTRGYYPPNVAVKNLEDRHAQQFLASLNEAAERAAEKLPEDYPKNGIELFERLAKFDTALAKQGFSEAGQLLVFITDQGKATHFPATMDKWDKPSQIKVAVGWAKDYEARQREKVEAEKKKPAACPPKQNPAAAPNKNMRPQPASR